MLRCIREFAQAVRARLRRKAMDGKASSGAAIIALQEAAEERNKELKKVAEKRRKDEINLSREFWLKTFIDGYIAMDGEEIPIGYEMPINEYNNYWGTGRVLIVGGWADRKEISSLAVVALMAYEVGGAAARYLRRDTSVKANRYQEGVLIAGGVDGQPMPEGYKPLHIQLIIKQQMGATDGTGDPLGSLKPGEKITTVGWKALCVEEVTRHDH